jgi:phosphatidate cytidylyltransferase
MLRTRLWMGALLVALVTGVLLIDQWLAPFYPFLMLLVLGLSLVACDELLRLLKAYGIAAWLVYVAVAGILVVNWLPHIFKPTDQRTEPDAWPWILGAFTATVLAAFVVEMGRFREPGNAVARMAFTIWMVAYLAVLPSFLVQLRWLPSVTHSSASRATGALALAIFVPKCGDIGAYLTGRLIGRHRMAPVLSPKKTWEGAAGGFAASVLASIGIDRVGDVVRGGVAPAAALGAAVGVAGMLGDLAESLIKRDCQQKDASQVVPGFGGVLDVVDAILFAAPIAYGGVIWLS